ncbi:MAG: PAS domain-containing sensor histidine kinase [Nitriliruptoraceae bacterium]|nr:PAS domain-containing sensor histidine kinase [Nitriliruptoraceae bacterium]
MAEDPQSVAEAVVTCGPLAVLVLDEGGLIQQANPAAETLLQRPGAELVGSDALELIAEEERAAAQRRLLEVAVASRAHLQMDVVTPAGRVQVGFSAAPLMVDGARRGLVLMGRDIRDRIAVEQELAELAASTRALSASSDVGMYRFGFVPRMHLADLNPAFVSIMGFSAEELLAHPSPLWTNVPADIVERFAQNRLGADPDWPLEWDWTRKDGTVRTISVTEVPIHDAEGRLKAALGICRDVTEERRAKQTLEQALDRERAALDREREALHREREATRQLRRVDELRRLFLQAVSHELRTPLTAVHGFALTLASRLDDLEPAQVRDLSARLARQADRLRGLLDDLLDIERAGRGVTTLTRTRVDVAALVDRIASEHAPTAALELVEAVAWIDRVKVERVVVNLLANAYRHAGAGAAVVVRVASTADRVRIVVEDDGPGIEEHLRATMFEPFRQGPGAADAPSPGTGIGLTLVAEFVRLHGGTVAIEDAATGGACFVVDLPVGEPG